MFHSNSGGRALDVQAGRQGGTVGCLQPTGPGSGRHEEGDTANDAFTRARNGGNSRDLEPAAWRSAQEDLLIAPTFPSPQPPDPAARTDLDRAQAHFEALYRLDAQGRMVGRAAPGEGASPRFHFMRTRLGSIWRFGEGLPGETLRDLARFAALEPGVALDASVPPAPPDRVEPMRRVLEAQAPIEATWSGPAFHMPSDAAGRSRFEALAAGAEVASDPADERLPEWADALGESLDAVRAALPLAVSRFEGGVVSSCRVARGDAVRFAEAGVETLASARGRGHATRCVAAWALAIEAGGGSPLYSTQWSNRGSRRVAEKLGWLVYAEDWHFR